MGLDVTVAKTGEWPVLPVLAILATRGLSAQIIMVDNALFPPNREPPPAWRDLRLKTPAGMLTLKRREGGCEVVVFGNADAELLAAQRLVADVLAAS